MQIRKNNNKDPEEVILQENIKNLSEVTNIVIIVIIIATAIAVTGVLLDVW